MGKSRGAAAGAALRHKARVEQAVCVPARLSERHSAHRYERAPRHTVRASGRSCKRTSPAVIGRAAYIASPPGPRATRHGKPLRSSAALDAHAKRSGSLLSAGDQAIGSPSSNNRPRAVARRAANHRPPQAVRVLIIDPAAPSRGEPKLKGIFRISPRAPMASARQWWASDEVNLVAACLDARSLGAFASCCRTVREHLGSPATLKWISELRGLQLTNVGCVEHLELAEAMATVTTCTYFGWASFEVDPAAVPGLRRLAQMLARHPSLRLSIEGHCGLEAQYHLFSARQARDYTRRRAEAVAQVLQHEAAALGVSLKGRLVTRAWGYSRPRAWVVAMPRDDGTEVPEEIEALAATNRRVEIFLRSGDFEVPRRPSRCEASTPPGAPSHDRRSRPSAARGGPPTSWGAGAEGSSGGEGGAAGESGAGGSGLGTYNGCASFGAAECTGDGCVPKGLDGCDSDDGGGEQDPCTPGTEHGESLVLLALPSGRRMAVPIGLLRMLELLPGEEDMETDSEEEGEAGRRGEELEAGLQGAGVQGVVQGGSGSVKGAVAAQLGLPTAEACEGSPPPCCSVWTETHAPGDDGALREPRLLFESSSASSSCTSLADQAAAGEAAPRRSAAAGAGIPAAAVVAEPASAPANRNRDGWAADAAGHACHVHASHAHGSHARAADADAAASPAATAPAVAEPVVSPVPAAFGGPSFPLPYSCTASVATSSSAPASLVTSSSALSSALAHGRPVFPSAAFPPVASPPATSQPSTATGAIFHPAGLTTAGCALSPARRALPSPAPRELSCTTIKRARK